MRQCVLVCFDAHPPPGVSIYTHLCGLTFYVRDLWESAGKRGRAFLTTPVVAFILDILPVFCPGKPVDTAVDPRVVGTLLGLPLYISRTARTHWIQLVDELDQEPIGILQIINYFDGPPDSLLDQLTRI